MNKYQKMAIECMVQILESTTASTLEKIQASMWLFDNTVDYNGN